MQSRIIAPPSIAPNFGPAQVADRVGCELRLLRVRKATLLRAIARHERSLADLAASVGADPEFHRIAEVLARATAEILALDRHIASLTGRWQEAG